MGDPIILHLLPGGALVAGWGRRLVAVAIVFGSVAAGHAATIALWLFDEQLGTYPSCVLGDAATGNYPLVLGTGGELVPGRFGNALDPVGRPPVQYPPELEFSDDTKQGQFGLTAIPESQHAITWRNGGFCGLMTRGEQQLRQEVGFGSPTGGGLNLGSSDWTVEFWYRPTRRSQRPGVVLEVGTGPRALNPAVTQLQIDAEAGGFVLVNEPGRVELPIRSDPAALAAERSAWHHLAFVYDQAEGQLRHYVDGVLQRLPAKCELQPLPAGEQDYLSVGRDGRWGHRLPGRIDELRVSDTQVYRDDFSPPESFSRYDSSYQPPPLKQGPPLLFEQDRGAEEVVPLEGRRHLFLDDALIAEHEHIEWVANPPRLDELIIEDRGVDSHLVVFEDMERGDGLIRLYARGPRRSLAVWTSRDGVHFTAPDLGRDFHGARNVVVEDPVGLGTVFADPNAPPAERIKYFSGYRGRGCYVWSSPDGFHFHRNETSALPFRAASQSIVYYDDQRQRYVGFHRSDMEQTPGGKSARTSVMTETTDLMRPWPMQPVSQAEQTQLATTRRLGRKNPYYIDNGPLTPPGFGLEFARAFGPVEGLDPVGVDVYVPKCVKYPWASDAYLAFPIMYFHYQGDGPATRRALGRRETGRGSGPLETQLAVSRDGVTWKRYPRPAYVGIGRHAGLDIKKAYLGHGMVRRGEEIWQYYVGSELYHSPWENKQAAREAIFRVVQRVDGFVSVDTPYAGGQLTTRPLRFAGNRLVLNLDTAATGFAQVGLLDEQGAPIEGFGVDDCIYLNGDFVDAEVQWIDAGKDLSHLAGRPVRVVIRSRGTKLYSLQFVER
jgi:hypothetical protein